VGEVVGKLKIKWGVDMFLEHSCTIKPMEIINKMIILKVKNGGITTTQGHHEQLCQVSCNSFLQCRLPR
jgi:hypothetical protein